MDMMTTFFVELHLLNSGTGENVCVNSTIDVDEYGEWNFPVFSEGVFSCDCVRSEMLYSHNPVYLLPCNQDSNIITLNISVPGVTNSFIYKETIVEEDKQKKIMKEIQNLTPYLSELQEFKENGLFLPAGAEGNKPKPIFNEQGRRIDSKSKKEKNKSNGDKRRELRAQATKLRVLTINKWLDERFTALLPKWGIKLIRKWPHLRTYVLMACFVKVEIIPSSKPKPFGSDIITIKCFWAIYDKVHFVWER